MDKVIECAQKFSANCCKSIDNSIDKEFGEAMRKEPYRPDRHAATTAGGGSPYHEKRITINQINIFEP